MNTCNAYEKIQSVEKIEKQATELLDSLIDDSTAVIGVTGQMHGIVYTNKEGRAVSPLYTWQDGRGNLPYKGTTYAKHLGSFSGYGLVTDFYNRENGIRPSEATGFCTIHDYFVMRLCGLKAPFIHSTDAASFGLYDVENNRFLCDCEIEPITQYHIAGSYKGIPVSVAIGDNQASAFSAIADSESILLNVGTGSQVSVVSSCSRSGNNIETRPYFENKYLLVGAALCGGRAYSLLKSFFSDILKYTEPKTDEEVYKIMDLMLKDAQSEQPLIVDTRFAGTRQNTEICGSVCKITTENFTPGSFVRGTINGIAAELYNMYLEMGEKRNAIVGSGNGIRKNVALCKAFEKLFNAEMMLPRHIEEAAYGAALFGYISSGCLKNAADASRLIKYKNRGEEQ